MTLRDWVEKGTPQERIDVSSRNGSVSMPLCLYRRFLFFAAPPSVSHVETTFRLF